MDSRRTASSALAIEGQGVYFYHAGRKQVPTLRGVDIKVRKGAIYGLLGPSGCGKTTLLRCVVGRHKPSSGTLKVYDRTPGDTGFCIPGKGVGYMPQELALYSDMTTEETLTYFGRLYQMESKHIDERIDFLVKFLDVPSKTKLIRNLSGGQQRRVSFAAALIHKPPLLVLDEPTVGVDPVLRQSIWCHLETLATQDYLTILITTHYVEEARQANVVGLMRNGHLLAEMNPEELIRQHQVYTLEDVFLKLCQGEGEEKNIYDAEQHLISPEVVSDGSSDIWIPREVHPVQSINSHLSHRIYSGDYENGISSGKSPSWTKNDDLLLERSIMNGGCGIKCKAAARRMQALMAKNFLRLRRNIPFAVFQVFVPAFQVVVFCLCMGAEPFDLPFGIVNQDTTYGSLGVKFLENLSNKTFKQIAYDDFDEAIHSVKEGKAWGVLHIGSNFTSCLIERFLQGSEADNDTINGSEIKLHLDLTNQQIAATIYFSVTSSFQTFTESMLNQINKNPRLAESPITIAHPVYGKVTTNFTEFMAPGMILSIVYIIAIGLTAMSVIIEKKEGLLERSWAAGVNPAEVMFSIALMLFTTMLAQVVLVLVCTFFVFDIPVLGPIGWAVICILLVGISGISYGLFISSLCDEENVAMMLAMGSFYPVLLISGILWPIEAMPYYLRYISYSLPLTLIANSFRSILSRGWSVTEHDIWDGLVISIAWAILFIFLSVIIFKYKK